MSETNKNMKRKQHVYSDSSFWALIASNLVVIVWALLEEWSLDSMLWVYVFQNVILGFFWPAKVLESPVDSSYIKKVQSIAVFMPHYFIINFLYALSLYPFFGEELFINFKSLLSR